MFGCVLVMSVCVYVKGCCGFVLVVCYWEVKVAWAFVGLVRM